MEGEAIKLRVRVIRWHRGYLMTPLSILYVSVR